MKWKCPHCEMEIESLRYDVATREWGSAYLFDPENENSRAEISEHESSDSERSGDVEYFCPECDDSIDLSNLLLIETEQEEKPIIKKLEEEKFNIIKPEINLQIEKENINQTESTMICKHCFYVFVYSTERYGNNEEFTDCPNCGQQNNKEEYKKLITDRFFEKVKIKRLRKKHAKKTKSRRVKLVG